MRQVIWIVALAFFSVKANAQINLMPDSTLKVKRDSIRQYYVKSFPDKFYIKPILTARSLSLEFSEVNNRAARMSYKPSSSSYFGLGLYAFDIGLELSFKLPQSESETPKAIFGETKSFDFQSNIYTKKWGADIALQRYDGLYLDKPNAHNADWRAGDPYPQRPDLNLRNFQINTFYVFNHHRFSYRSAYNQADRQLKSAGSPLIGLFVSTYRYNADSTLIPTSAQAVFPQNADMRFGRITTLALLPGYTHTFVYRKFYFNASLSIGPGHLWVKYNENDFEKEDILIRAVYNVRAAMGYNGDWFFGGITLVNQVVSAKINNMEVNGLSGNVKFFIGFRIDEFGVLKK